MNNMLKRITVAVIGLLVCMTVLSQTKHTFSLGYGTENAFNGMITPYNLKGTKIIHLDYGNEKFLRKEWKSFFNAGMGISSSRLDYDFANNLTSGQPYVLGFDASLHKSFLKRVLDRDMLTVHAGFITSIQGNYQVSEYTSIPGQGGHAIDFFQIGISEGISASTQLRLKKIILQNTTSYLIAGAILYPNYSSDRPFNNKVGDYFTFTTVNKRNYVENRLKVEFPLYIKDKFINSFTLYHDFKYEYSTIKDNVFMRLEHSIHFGLLFKLEKFKIDAR